MIATVTNVYDQMDGSTNVVLNIANDPAAQRGIRRFVNKEPVSLGIFSDEGEIAVFPAQDELEPRGFEVTVDGVTGEDFYGERRAILSNISDEVADELMGAMSAGDTFRLVIEEA